MRISFVRDAISDFVCLDPEVHIALENLQQFPAFSPCAGEAADTEDLSGDLLSPVSRSPISQPGTALFTQDVAPHFEPASSCFGTF